MNNPQTNAVQANSHVTLHYEVALPDGQVVVSTYNDSPATILLGQNYLSPGLEAQLMGKKVDDEICVQLPPKETFGDRIDELIQYVPREVVAREGDADNDYVVGDVVEFNHEQMGRLMGVVIDTEREDAIGFDFNHPLAGQDIIFKAKIISVLDGESV